MLDKPETQDEDETIELEMGSALAEQLSHYTPHVITT